MEYVFVDQVHMFVFADMYFLQYRDVCTYMRVKNTCARTSRSKRGGGLFSGEYGT